MPELKLRFNPATQRCKSCGEVKPVTEFYRQAYTQLPSHVCKRCTTIKQKMERPLHRTRVSKFISKEKQRSPGENVNYTVDDYRDALIQFGDRCCYCGAKEGRKKDTRFDREHFVPLSRGGKTTRNNIGPACPKCNRSRGNMRLFDWFRAQPFYTEKRARKIVEWIGVDAAREEGWSEPSAAE